MSPPPCKSALLGIIWEREERRVVGDIRKLVQAESLRCMLCCCRHNRILAIVFGLIFRQISLKMVCKSWKNLGLWHSITLTANWKSMLFFFLVENDVEQIFVCFCYESMLNSFLHSSHSFRKTKTRQKRWHCFQLWEFLLLSSSLI